MMEKTSSRVAMALLCGLAICCAVMYITADGESVLASESAAKSVYGMEGPTSVETEDVEKAGVVVTNTPDGRMRLTDYLTNVEKEIAAESAARKRDVAAARAQMERNFEFNKEARKKLKAAMLAKMAANAKKAEHDLHKSMVFVQKKFHDAADLQNKRNNANIARSKKLRATIETNKQEAKAHLKKAVMAANRARATAASAVNQRIDQTNKHVAANAAQIKSNAKAAREALDKAVALFNQKVANARQEAAEGRSALATQLENQDKALRQYANNKLQTVMAKTAAQFERVREKMAADRQHVDLALKGATERMTASLNAFEALNDKRFKQTVKDIAAAKKEAEDRVAAASQTFKTSLYALQETVKNQVKHAQTRIDQLTNTVQHNKVAQAKVNAHVAAEQKRMVKLGNDRYQAHLKKDKELGNLIKANKAATDKRMKAMAAQYTAELNEVKAEMKKNRAHATHMLAKKSAALYSAIAKSEREQHEENAKLAAQTAQAKRDIEDSLNEAKDDFTKRIGNLHKVVTDNDKKFEKKIHKLNGIVDDNAAHNAQERKNLKTIMDANKKALDAEVREAIHKGAVRMQQAEDKLVKMSEKSKSVLNLRITSEISRLTKRANEQILGLRMNSKEARDEMKKELLLAVRAMEEEAKRNLDAAKDAAIEKFGKVNNKLTKAEAKSAADRAAIAEEAKIQKENAKEELEAGVSMMARATFALKYETRKAIKKSNMKVDAYAEQIKKEAKDVAALMKSQMDKLNGAIESQKEKAKAAIGKAQAASAAQWTEVNTEVQNALAAANKKTDAKFTEMFDAMATQRSELDKNLATAFGTLNDELAKQSALADTRFRKTVKDIEAARSEAREDVKEARREFATRLATVTSGIKAMDKTLLAQVEVISGEVVSHIAEQSRVNRHVQTEITRIDKLINDQHSVSERARGKLRQLLDENKKVAHDEVEALRTYFDGENTKIRKKAHDDAEAASNDLADASQKMFEAMAEAQKENSYANEESAKKIGEYSTESLAAIAASKKDFTERMDQLALTIAANHEKVEKGFEKLTDVIRMHKTEGENDRALIREQNEAMNEDMKSKIRAAIMDGEAKAKKVADRATENLADAKKTLLVKITDTVEDVADAAFKAIQGKYTAIADNYLSLKAYAVTAEKKIVAYVGKGKGKNLSSLGDLLVNIAAVSSVPVKKEEGLSPEDHIGGLFVNDQIAVDNSLTKVNGLVNEFAHITFGVRERWNVGLGKYLLLKLEASMSEKGVLQVDKIDSKSGNWVFINGHAVGLSNKLNDFESLAVRMGHYEASLAKLTASLSGKKKAAVKPKIHYVPGPEYDGD